MIIAPYVGLGRHELGRLGRPCRQTEPPRSAPSRYGASASAHLQWGHRLSAMETSSPALPVCCPFAAPLLPLCFAAPLLPLCCPCCPFAAPSMGPPPLAMETCPPAHAHTLQWGHRLSAMETLLRPGWESATHLAASMGPPPFGDGNAVSGATVEEFERLLQWGHRLSAMEMTIVQAEVGRGYELQWGHRLSAMETSKSGRARNITSSGFNGATAFRRWKQRLPAKSETPRLRFNGATAFRRWKRSLAGTRRSTRTSRFNGATAFRRWKPKAPCGPWVGASCFNGATAFRRWKRVSANDGISRMLMLQWGHRLSAMETWGNWPLGTGCPQASMGPPPFGDGNEGPSLGHTLDQPMLQWGHRLSAMETSA